jgi:branched-chain amino acid transport system permease protein
MVGGVLLGLLEGGVTAVGLSKIRDVVAFGILILIMLYRPTGLFGRRQ